MPSNTSDPTQAVCSGLSKADCSMEATIGCVWTDSMGSGTYSHSDADGMYHNGSLVNSSHGYSGYGYSGGMHHRRSLVNSSYDYSDGLGNSSTDNGGGDQYRGGGGQMCIRFQIGNISDLAAWDMAEQLRSYTSSTSHLEHSKFVSDLIDAEERFLQTRPGYSHETYDGLPDEEKAFFPECRHNVQMVHEPNEYAVEGYVRWAYTARDTRPLQTDEYSTKEDPSVGGFVEYEGTPWEFHTPGSHEVTALVAQAGKRSSEKAIRLNVEWEQVAPALITPNGGAFLSSQSVTISSATPDAMIRYASGAAGQVVAPACVSEVANLTGDLSVYRGALNISAPSSGAATTVFAIACKVCASC